MVTRREFLKLTGATMAGLALTSQGFTRVLGAPAVGGIGLSDPANQDMFTNAVPDALAPGFKYQPDKKGIYKIRIGASVQNTGLKLDGIEVPTPVWGYGAQTDKIFTWPGKTFEIQSSLDGGPAVTEVNWENKLQGVAQHLLPVDTNLHWCFSLHKYTKYSIDKNGVPIITHLHGGHTDFQFDGNPEFFYTPMVKNKQVVGPQWANTAGGFSERFVYDNAVPAGNLWYHDHALGITRLNVYAGLAGFYFIRDGDDTGLPNNTYGLPAWPYEKAYAIQDRMFLATGELFYPAFPGDPYYADFIDGEGAVLPPSLFPGGGPTALAEFFGDHMVVNGKIWPYEQVEPRNYRLHLLNGMDSRFMALRFRAVPLGATDFSNASEPLPFTVIGSDQGLADSGTTTDMLLSEPGSRYDVVFDFDGFSNQRIIMENIGGDEPFGGEFGDQLYERTNRIMAFDVTLNINDATNAVNLPAQSDDFVANLFFTGYGGVPAVVDMRTRKVALFEGKDEFGRLQPLLGTAEPATDFAGNPINWPNTPVYQFAGLTGQMEGSVAWHSPTTENPALGATEEWEVWNATGDAHPVHLHLVHFEVFGRKEIFWDSHTISEGDELPDGSTADPDDETRLIPNDFYTDPAGDGTYLVTQTTVQHNSVAGDPTTYGMGFKLVNLTTGDDVVLPDNYVENTPKDMVTALPGQVTMIRAKFDKPGRYVWHCHILSHEDHEMMRVLHVGPGA